MKTKVNLKLLHLINFIRVVLSLNKNIDERNSTIFILKAIKSDVYDEAVFILNKHF